MKGDCEIPQKKRRISHSLIPSGVWNPQGFVTIGHALSKALGSGGLILPKKHQEVLLSHENVFDVVFPVIWKTELQFLEQTGSYRATSQLAHQALPQLVRHLFRWTLQPLFGLVQSVSRQTNGGHRWRKTNVILPVSVNSGKALVYRVPLLQCHQRQHRIHGV